MIKIDVQEMANGMQVADHLRGNTPSGIPWITILDSDGTELVNSDSPNGNIGCPVTDVEQAWFNTMIEKTVQHSSTAEVATMQTALAEYAETLK